MFTPRLYLDREGRTCWGEGARSCTCSEHNSMWIRARGAWVEQTPTTNMCHSINRMAHTVLVYDRLFRISILLVFFRRSYARENSIIFIHVNPTAATNVRCKLRIVLHFRYAPFTMGNRSQIHIYCNIFQILKQFLGEISEYL